MREDSEYKLQLIDEFRKTLDSIEWNEKCKIKVREQHLQAHEEFIEKVTRNKVFKYEVYAAEKLID
jgi:hypothetical protein